MEKVAWTALTFVVVFAISVPIVNYWFDAVKQYRLVQRSKG